MSGPVERAVDDAVRGSADAVDGPATSLGAPVQLAYAVEDVDAAARRWSARGVGPFFVVEHIGVHDVRVRGEPGAFDHSSAYAQWGPVMLELICQHDGGHHPVVGTTGLHHVAFFVSDLDRTARRLEDRGWPEILRASTAGGVTFAFHDARHELGHLVEIYEPSERITRFYALVRDTADGWDGRAPVRRV